MKPVPFIPPYQQGCHSHSGDLGDTLYALAVARAGWRLTGRRCMFALSHVAALGISLTPRVAYTPELAAVIAPLIAAQEYISEVVWSRDVVTRLGNWRWGAEAKGWVGNLVGLHFDTFPELPCTTEPWLKVEPVPSSEFVIWRTFRWRGSFDYARWLQEHRGRNVVFLGGADEHAVFCREFRCPGLRHRPTADLLEAARVIAGAGCCVGNQTSLLAIAQGLGKRVLLEVAHGPASGSCLINTGTHTIVDHEY